MMAKRRQVSLAWESFLLCSLQSPKEHITSWPQASAFWNSVLPDPWLLWLLFPVWGFGAHFKPNNCQKLPPPDFKAQQIGILQLAQWRAFFLRRSASWGSHFGPLHVEAPVT